MRLTLIALAAAVAVLSGLPAPRLTARTPDLPASGSPAAQRFLARSDTPLARFIAHRHLEAATRGGSMRGWLDACTELGPEGFRYRVLNQGGSGLIVKRVLVAALETEQRTRASGEADRAALLPANYDFIGGDAEPDGLTRVVMHPRRADVMLLDGTIFLTADSDLVRVEGRLAKRPSFWTRRVYVVRRYARIGDVRVPVGMESKADVLIVGQSSFAMTYDYASINGGIVPGRGASAAACTGAPGLPEQSTAAAVRDR